MTTYRTHLRSLLRVSGRERSERRLVTLETYDGPVAVLSKCRWGVTYRWLPASGLADGKFHTYKSTAACLDAIASRL